MPIWLRRFTFEKIRTYYEEKQKAEQEAMDKAKGIEKAKPTVKGPPQVKPSYTTKASTK